MNGKRTITSILIGAVAFGAVLGYGRAASQPAAPAPKIGLVSIRDAFNGSKKHALYQAQAAKRQAQANAQLDQLNNEMETEESELKKLKPGSADYLQQLQVALEKRAKLQTQQEVVKQQWLLEGKNWLEAVYQEVLKAAEAVAKERGLDFVLERTEPKFPMSNEELRLTISTHKVLYGAGAVDLTNDVIARIDAGESLKP